MHRGKGFALTGFLEVKKRKNLLLVLIGFFTGLKTIGCATFAPV
jgi:hypothetical protein